MLILVLDNKQSRAGEFCHPSREPNVVNRLAINLRLLKTYFIVKKKKTFVNVN